MKKKRSVRDKIIMVLLFILLFISILIFCATNYYKAQFGGQVFENLIYNVQGNVECANLEVIVKGLKASIIPFIIFSIIVLLPIVVKNKDNSLKLFPLKKNIKSYAIYTISIFLLVIISSLSRIGTFTYLKSQLSTSEVFEEEYVPTKDVKLEFPDKKRNLIYIFMESMESSLFTINNGGGYPYPLMPELEAIALNNTNFSDDNDLGGAMQVIDTGWTVAGMVAQTAGVPLKMNTNNGYDKFLSGVYSLGDILDKEGYNLEIMMGSDASFGSRKDYFTDHGNYLIYDVNEAIKRGKMKKEDRVWWGFDDEDLFEWSKEELTNLAKSDKPFNYMLLTADTHFVDGYLSDKSFDKYLQKYENVHAYSSKLVSEFIDWIMQQDFYDNTTIVIVGDHLGMQTKFYDDNLIDDYDRRILNIFINSVLKEENNFNREFSTMDIFPTVLASMGVKIDGDRLGLGTNLYSGKKTLIEEIGFKEFDKEIAKKSKYYKDYLE